MVLCWRMAEISEERLALGERETECEVAGGDCVAEKKVREGESSDQCFPR